jgi:hypothetical protein
LPEYKFLQCRGITKLKIFASLSEFFNKPHVFIARYKKSRKWLPALIIVLLTAFMSIPFGLIPYFLAIEGVTLKKQIVDLVVNFIVVIVSYFAACGVLKITALIRKKKTTYLEILSSWGFSYIPDLLFLVFLLLTHLFLPKEIKIFATAPVSIILVAILVSLLIWKLIFFFIELRIVLEENFAGIIISSVIIFIFFIIYYVIAAYAIGYKIPIV